MIFGTTLGDTPFSPTLLGDGGFGDGLGNVAVGGYVGVNLLQKALRELAVKTQNSDCDPATYDGTMNLGTIIALANTAPTLGKQVHPMVGKALDIVNLLKKPFDVIPYGSSVIDVILSPWLIDNVYEIVLAIIRLFPGGGSIATGITTAMTAFKGALAPAAAPLAGVITLATTKVSGSATNPAVPTLSGLGNGFTLSPTFLARLNATQAGPNVFRAEVPAPATSTSPNPPPGYTWVNDHWERLRAGQTPVRGPVGANVTIRRHPTMATAPIISAPLTPTMSAAAFIASVRGAITRDHRAWPKGKPLANSYGASDWDERVEYSAKVPMADLYAGDAVTWRNLKNARHEDVAQGRAAFRRFKGKQGQQLGAFWSAETQILRIKRVPIKPSKKGRWYDFATDAIDDVGDFVSASWDWVQENADEVYAFVKKYSCLVVNNDIVVAVAAAGAGIVATPAASATVVAGAVAGRAACTALTIGEAVYAIIKFLAMGHASPPSLTGPAGSTTSTGSISVPAPTKAFLASRLNLRYQAGMAGFTVVLPPTPPTPLLKPSAVFPMPASFGWTALTNTQLAGLAVAGVLAGVWVEQRRA